MFIQPARYWRNSKHLLEYLSTVFTNLLMSGDSQRPLGDYLGDNFGEYLQEYLRQIIYRISSMEISWNLEICENRRDIYIYTPKVSLELYRPSVESRHGQEGSWRFRRVSGRGDLAKHHCKRYPQVWPKTQKQRTYYIDSKDSDIIYIPQNNFCNYNYQAKNYSNNHQYIEL